MGKDSEQFSDATENNGCWGNSRAFLQFPTVLCSCCHGRRVILPTKGLKDRIQSWRWVPFCGFYNRGPGSSPPLSPLFYLGENMIHIFCGVKGDKKGTRWVLLVPPFTEGPFCYPMRGRKSLCIHILRIQATWYSMQTSKTQLNSDKSDIGSPISTAKGYMELYFPVSLNCNCFLQSQNISILVVKPFHWEVLINSMQKLECFQFVASSLPPPPTSTFAYLPCCQKLFGVKHLRELIKACY